MSDLIHHFNRVNKITGLCNNYEKKLVTVNNNRQNSDKTIDVQNRLYNPTRNIGTSTDILRQFRVLEDYGESYYGLELLRGLDIASTIILLPNLIALRGKILVDTGNEEINEEIGRELKRLNYKDILSRALMYAKISSYGSVVVAITNSEDKTSPLSNGEEILSFNVVSDNAFFYRSYHALSAVWDIDYHQPKNFYIGGLEADRSRFYHVILDYDSYRSRGRNILQENIGALLALNILETTYSYQLVQSQIKMVKFPAERTKAGASQAVKTEIERFVKRIKDNVTNQDFITFPDDFQMELVNLIKS